MEADYAAKQIERLSVPITNYLEAEPFRADEAGKFSMETELWLELLSMTRSSGIDTEKPPAGANMVTLEAPYLLIFVRLARCWLDGKQFGERL